MNTLELEFSCIRRTVERSKSEPQPGLYFQKRNWKNVFEGEGFLYGAKFTVPLGKVSYTGSTIR